jgi:uncharacterized protein (TIGR03437 family)
VTAPATVSLSAGGTATLAVTMSLSAAVLGNYEGTVVLTSQSTSTSIHIPYFMALGPPTISAGGLVDGAQFGARVSSGDIVSLFGTGMGTLPQNATIDPLPLDIDHASVFITGLFQGGGNQLEFEQVPLFYSSGTQINFQMPYYLNAGGRTAPNVQIVLQGIPANSINFTNSATSPGIFVAGTTTAVVTHQSGALVTAANPAALGEIVTIYCAGLGPTSPYINEGDPGPIPPANTTGTPTVTIGGATEAISFSGLTPLFAGLYQINATISGSTPAGAQTITISIGGATSNSLTTYIQ